MNMHNRINIGISGLAIAISAAALLTLPGCGGGNDTSVKSEQAKKAAEAANSIAFTENAEIDNIKKRLELTSQPGLLGYIVLLNGVGQPVYYGTVKGKVTSGGKRLTRPDRSTAEGAGQNNVVMQAPSDEGTYGSSGEYIFFWTTSGQYMQWNDKYLYSDKPIRLTVQPLVVSVDAPASAAK
jgi:hypothetical protein